MYTRMLKVMLSELDDAYKKCTYQQDFRIVYSLLSSFRAIIMTWPCNEFSDAYNQIGKWQEENMEVR